MYVYILGVGNALPSSNSDSHLPDLDSLLIPAHTIESLFVCLMARIPHSIIWNQIAEI